MPAQKHGSRWLYQEPDEPQVKEWFDTQPLHDGMHHERYYGGIVLIPNTERYKRTMQRQDGATFVREDERLVFTPYVKVDTRIAYFWDLVRSLDSMVGVIEPESVKIIDDPSSPYFNAHLPKGYFMFPIRGAGESSTVSRYLGARWRVSIYERESWSDRMNGREVAPWLSGIGTKQVALVRKFPDDNVLMKVETSAIGRALGVAGILVVGTGVATAEDMQELSGPPTSASEPPAPTLPPAETPAAPLDTPPSMGNPEAEEDGEEPLRARMQALAKEFVELDPVAWEEYRRWYTEERKFPSSDQLSGPALRGALVKLERSLDAVKNTQS